MLRKIKLIALSLVLGIGVFAPLTTPALVYAVDIREGLCDGANLDANSTASCEPGDVGNAGSTATTLISDIINIFSFIVGVVAVIMIIVAGFRYITSGGNDSSVAGAKNTILYAIIGLIIVALAQFIVKFVLERATTAI